MKLSAAEHRALARWAAACAAHVLPQFEAVYPDDKRPRIAIAAVRAWIKGTKTVGAVRKTAFAAHAAARRAARHDEEAASAAARAAGQAAGVPHVAGHARHAAAYASKAAIDPSEEREWQARRAPAALDHLRRSAYRRPKIRRST